MFLTLLLFLKQEAKDPSNCFQLLDAKMFL